MRAVIVSDNQISSSYLRRILTHAGNEVFVVETLEGFMNATDLNHDLVLLEVNLPGTTHDQAKRKIEEVRKVPILPISAYSIQHEERVDDFQVALNRLRESNDSRQYIMLIESLLGVKIV